MASGGGWIIGTGASPAATMLSQMQAYATAPWLFATVDRIASSVASVDWKLFRAVRPGEFREVESHRLLDLWRKPNPFYSEEEFVEVSAQHQDLAGETYWLLLRNASRLIVEMWPVRPDRMKPIPSRDRYLAGYIYTVGSEQIPLEPEDVIFMRRPSPLDPYRGLGPVQSLMADIEADRSASQWMRNFFRNSAEPGGVIQFDEEMTDDAFNRLVSRWKEQHQGVANAHRVAVIEKGKWVDRKITQREMQFEQIRKFGRDIVLGAFGMPLPLLGITESVNRANAEAAEVMFARWVIRPRLRRLKDVLNTRLAPLFGTGLFFDFMDPVPENRQLALEEAERGYKSGVLTRNEARARLGEAAVEGGEQFVPLPMTMVYTEPVTKGTDPLLPDPVEAARSAMRRGWQRRLAAEAEALTEYLEQFKGTAGRTKLEVGDVAGYDWNWWAKYGDEVVTELSRGFSVSLTAEFPGMPPEQVQRLSSEYAITRGARLLRLDGDLNIAEATRRRVNEVVSGALERGESLGKVQKALREDFAFSRARADLVARTETATALGEGAKGAALAQGRNQKRWVTQGDEGVDEDCLANEAAGWIKVGDPFPSGHDVVPAHPDCRCANGYRTKEARGLRSVEGAWAASVTHNAALQTDRAILGEVRCPQCDKLLGKNEPDGARLYCRRCKAETVVAVGY